MVYRSLIVLPNNRHILWNVRKKVFIQVSRPLFFHIQVLLISCSRQLLWQRVVNLKSEIIRLIEFELSFIDRRPNTILLETDCLCDDFLVGFDINVVRFYAHFMHVCSSFVVHDVVLLILVKSLVA